MIYFNSLPQWVQAHRFAYDPSNVPAELLCKLRTRLARFQESKPEVSIIIPAYNEEESLLNMLSSLARQKTLYPTELIVANNNSKDHTQDLLDQVGVRTLQVTDQGAAFARQAALQAAKGRFIVNADADCLYPPTWINALIEPLHNRVTSCTYGTYSFLPSAVNSRKALCIHETAAQLIFRLRRLRGYECVNVMGFNFAFRRDDALSVGGFNTSFRRGIDAASDDGWMAMTLSAKGQIRQVKRDAYVWTSDRLLVKDGGVPKAFAKRLTNELRRASRYLRPADLPVAKPSAT
ncbi:glycosyl transferase family 2 [Fibrisoma limi BUZ 3]|uniref:Glycosyl transferase family 2 n=1 Tax=Fibrisoma limi BUZ 3 TaxID=1185876 RepID=I2GPQ4_9BACT|nr:glycosyltransferase family 2 protein [Fibrisoma limi]CCH55882.1 glycosyl transferase family 2 [Fibrisoma limi BUZ 3]